MNLSALVSAGRSLSRDPRFTIGFSVVLGVGFAGVLFVIGALQATVFRTIPWDAPTQLYSIQFRDNGIPRQWTVRDAATARALNIPGVAITWYSRFEQSVGVSGDSAALRVAVVEPRLFEVLGLRAREGIVTGATAPADEGVVILSSAARARLFPRGPAIGGRLRLGDRFSPVIGVLPGGVEFPLGTDLWRVEEAFEARSGERAVDVIVRDSAERSAQAVEELLTGAIAAALDRRAEPGVRTTVGATPLVEFSRPRIGRRTRVILAAIGSVVALIVVNLANALLLRAQRTLFGNAVRLTLGAPYSALVRRAVCEAALLAMTSLVIGAAIAYALAGVFRSLIENSIAGASVAVDIRCIPAIALALFAIMGALAIALVLPLRQVSPAVSLRAAMPSGTPSASRLRRLFLGLQVSASVLFLLVAVALGATYMRMSQLDVGYTYDDVGFATIGLRAEQFADPARVRSIAEEMATRARVALGVPDVAVWGTTYPHRLAAQTESPIQVPGRELPAQDPRVLPVLSLDVNRDYFAALGVALREGRLFDRSDVEGSAPVVILDELAARALYGDSGAIGRTLRLGGRESVLPWMTVVGVVASSQPIHPFALEWELAGTRYPLMYRPLAQTAPTALLAPLSDPGFSIAVAADDAATRAPATFSRLFSELTPGERASFSGSLRAFIDREGRIEASRSEAAALGLFGMLGILLAVLGVATAVDETLHARTREFGIRVALGAPAHAIMRLVCIGTLGPAAVGIVAGFLTFLLGRQAVISLLSDTPASTGSVTGVIPWLSIIAVAACTVIAIGTVAIWRSRRAAGIDPAIALRAD